MKRGWDNIKRVAQTLSGIEGELNEELKQQDDASFTVESKVKHNCYIYVICGYKYFLTRMT